MTEEEAKTKWCPFVRFAELDGRLWDNKPKGSDDPFCIASACMAWRGTPKPVTGIEYADVPKWVDQGYEVRLSDPDRDGTYTAVRSEGGFCGLAGAPQ